MTAPLDPPLGMTEWPATPERLLHPAHTALVILDMQNKFLGPETKSRASGMVEVVQGLLAAGRAAGVLPIFVHVNMLDREIGRTGGYLMKMQSITTNQVRGGPPAQADPVGDAFVPEIAPGPNDIVLQKVRFSAFFSTWLDNLLKNRGIRTLVLTGVASYGAVIATSFDAAWRDYYVVVPPTGVAGDNDQLHTAALTLIGQQSLIDEAVIRQIWSTWAERAEAKP
ncbi:MAG: isochorismatase [Chloroflexi bacterium]|nr:isochorismatase [Chloroflexota bacterium]